MKATNMLVAMVNYKVSIMIITSSKRMFLSSETCIALTDKMFFNHKSIVGFSS